MLVAVYVNGEAVAGVSVTLSGAERASKTTDAEGEARFDGISVGTYTVDVSGYVNTVQFETTAQTVSVGKGSSEMVEFDGTDPTRPEFVLIAAGSFQMGQVEQNEDQAPIHTVNITESFFLQKTEVTQAQWEAVIGTTPSAFAGCGDCPVEQVSWIDVQDFISKLNSSEPDRHYRLPTEAEWEYASRAGEAGRWWSVEELYELGWYAGNSGMQPHTVGTKQPNPWGLYDMRGNVYEWVQDWYSPSYYQSSPVDDPQGPVEGTQRVFRGGSWRAGYPSAGISFRAFREPSYRSADIGFRLVRRAP